MNRSLDRAREKGYLKTTLRAPLPEYSRWCWRLKIPVIWMERCSPRSRYGRVHLDLFTTPRVLTAAGRLALESLASHFSIAGKVTVSSHDAAWDRVVFAQIEPLARAVLRAVHNPANYKLDLPAPATLSFRQREVA